MNDQISPEYFHLIRKVLQEKKESPDKPLKKRRRTGVTTKEIDLSTNITNGTEPETIVEISSEPDVIDLSSPGSSTQGDTKNDSDFDENSSSEEDDSDEFEDVIEATETSPNNHADISITMDDPKSLNEIKRKKVIKKSRNVCSNEEKKFRRYFHMADLLCLMTHGAMRNSWINNDKLLRRLNKLIPDKTFKLLHPQKDDELPLRSTRKLLDGLKMCMELWQKHWKVTERYSGLECYMRHWDELKGQICTSKSLTEKEFVRKILKGHGNRDIANQGFVALLRSCNVNARLIMSCQPPDFTDLKEQNHSTSKKSPSEGTFKYPIFWCEVWNKFEKSWITIDPMNIKIIEQIRFNSKLEPRGVASCDRNLLRYVIAYDRKDGCNDVTRRYCHWFNAKCRKRRITKDTSGLIWYQKIIKRLHSRKRTKIDDYEDIYMKNRDENEGMPDNIQDLKSHPRYILEKDIRSNQILKSGCKECGYLNVNHKKKVLKVYERCDILDLKSARQWYNEGRILKIECKYLKIVEKKHSRNLESSEKANEERLYSFNDTELYVAPLATEPDGVIAKNTFGNIEILKPTMIPMNCCLIKSPVAIKAANFLQIEYARAVTGFKFEKGNITKPIIGGIVVAQWFKEAVLAAIDGIEYCVEREEFEKQDLENLNHWNMLLMKLRIKNNLNKSYGKVQEDSESLVKTASETILGENGDEDEYWHAPGGFIPQPTSEATPKAVLGNQEPEDLRYLQHSLCSRHENNSKSSDGTKHLVKSQSNILDGGAERETSNDFNNDSNNKDKIKDENEDQCVEDNEEENFEIENYNDDYDQFMQELDL